MKHWNRRQPTEAAKLTLGDEKLDWYTVEELFALGLNRGQLDRRIIQGHARWVTGRALADFLQAHGFGAWPLNPDIIYYHLSLEAEAAGDALVGLGVNGGALCVGCRMRFAEIRLLPNQFGQLFCPACIAKGEGRLLAPR